MKSLVNFISESLNDYSLNNEVEQEIIDFIKDNYMDIDLDKLEIVKDNNKYVVNYFDNLYVKNHRLEYLTNDLFEWGEVKKFGFNRKCYYLKSLKGGPKTVKGNFDINGSQDLKSLEGGPKIVEGDFSCESCGLENLKGAPEIVNGSFSCNYCKNLKSLEGATKIIGEFFSCEHCDELESLNGSPLEVRKSFTCSYCKNLKSLEGSPKKVGWDFNCQKCDSLTSVKSNLKTVDTIILTDCKNLESLKELDNVNFGEIISDLGNFVKD